MSALTDLFTSFANKIRSKVGGSQTYTPLEMVDAIDDVYDAGVASVPTPTDITPSNASPVALAANTPVNPTAGGYAIASYQSKTPSDSNPPSVSSGAIIKASAAGYLRTHADLYATTLWTNSNPNTSYAGGDVTLSQDIDNFKYIGFRFKDNTASSSVTSEILVTPTNLKKSTGASNPRVALGANNSSSVHYLRGVAYVSDTKVSIGVAYRLNSSGSDNSLAIPTSIVGYN